MILENCKLVAEPCDAGVPQVADVVTGGNKTIATVPCGTPAEREHKRMNIYGVTLLPELIDAHMHLFMGEAATDGRDHIVVPAQWTSDCYSYTKFFLDNGYTTIRDMGDELHYSRLITRNAIDEGIMQEPRIYGSGVMIVPVTAGFDACEYLCGLCGTKEDVRRMAGDQFSHEASFLKLYGAGSMLVGGSLPGKRTMLEDEIVEAVTMAESKGSYCACHCHRAEVIGVMIEQGVRTIEHVSFTTNEFCKKLDEREDTEIVSAVACSCPEALGVTENTGTAYEKFSHVSAERDTCIRNTYENHDILTGWRTDMSLGSMQANPYMEWQTRKNHLGISNLDLLEQTTINSTVLVGVDNKIGAVFVGGLTDFIVVDGDLIVDITAMYKKPVHVIKDGGVVR